MRDNRLYGGIQAPGLGEFAVQPLDATYHVIQQAGPTTKLATDDTHLPEPVAAPKASAATAAQSPASPALTQRR